MAVLVVEAVLGSAAIALVGFALYLAFCTFVVARTGGTSGLRDVAVAIWAFASVGSLSARCRPGPMPPAQAAEPDQMAVPNPGLTTPALVIPPLAGPVPGPTASAADSPVEVPDPRSKRDLRPSDRPNWL